MPHCEVPKEVKLRDVKTNALLQISDLLIGSVGFHTNRPNQRDRDTPKAKLARYVAERAGLTELSTPTDRRHDFGFSIWHFDLQ